MQKGRGENASALIANVKIVQNALSIIAYVHNIKKKKLKKCYKVNKIDKKRRTAEVHDVFFWICLKHESTPCILLKTAETDEVHDVLSRICAKHGNTSCTLLKTAETGEIHDVFCRFCQKQRNTSCTHAFGRRSICISSFKFCALRKTCSGALD